MPAWIMEQKNIFVDIDDTIAFIKDKSIALMPDGTIDYSKALPNNLNIKKVNQFYDQGHRITYWTARGTKTGIDWRSVTEYQLDQWGAKHHQLKMGKPAFDLFIDDKVLNVKNWNNESVNEILKQH
jgi:hypothetical protein